MDLADDILRLMESRDALAARVRELEAEIEKRREWSAALADTGDQLRADRQEARQAAQTFLHAILTKPGWKPDPEKVYRDLPWLKPPGE